MDTTGRNNYYKFRYPDDISKENNSNKFEKTFYQGLEYE
ncbi:MAG: hypothetical protein CM15mV20_2900 [uncultured marine virus]|nr:MAG: hypothetical protein CM15mV20_2900 [uncultured marine virus]